MSDDSASAHADSARIFPSVLNTRSDGSARSDTFHRGDTESARALRLRAEHIPVTDLHGLRISVTVPILSIARDTESARTLCLCAEHIPVTDLRGLRISVTVPHLRVDISDGRFLGNRKR